MKLDIKPGRYVVAVSGGVDSVVLLYLLVQQKKPKANTGDKRRKAGDYFQLVVAHFDHGIREDSAEDREFVQRLAASYGLPFVFDAAQLGPKASEETARKARYEFLHRTKEAANADAIITAHHQDDVIETAIINLLRGTGRRGLTALKSDKDIIRPLLHVTKQEILDFAKEHELAWREDATNKETKYLRNYIRKNLVPRFSEQRKQELLGYIKLLRDRNREIDESLAKFLDMQLKEDVLDRHQFVMLPHSVAKEVMAAWLRQNGIAGYTARLLEQLVTDAKTLQKGKRLDVNDSMIIVVGEDELALRPRER